MNDSELKLSSIWDIVFASKLRIAAAVVLVASSLLTSVMYSGEYQVCPTASDPLGLTKLDPRVNQFERRQEIRDCEQANSSAASAEHPGIIAVGFGLSAVLMLASLVPMGRRSSTGASEPTLGPPTQRLTIDESTSALDSSPTPHRAQHAVTSSIPMMIGTNDAGLSSLPPAMQAMALASLADQSREAERERPPEPVAALAATDAAPASISEYRIASTDENGQAGWWIELPRSCDTLELVVRCTPLMPLRLAVATDERWQAPIGVPEGIARARTTLPAGRHWFVATVTASAPPPASIELWLSDAAPAQQSSTERPAA